MKFTEAQLEDGIIRLLGEQGYPHVIGDEINRGMRGKESVFVNLCWRSLRFVRSCKK